MNRLLPLKNFMLIFMYYIIIFSLVYLVGIMLTLDLSFTGQILTVLVIATSAKLIVQNRRSIYIIFIIAVIIKFIPHSTAPQVYMFFEGFMKALNNIYEHLFMNKLILWENILYFWILIIAVYSICTSVVIFILKRGMWALILIYIPLFIYYWYVNIPHTHFALTVFLFSYLVVYGQLKLSTEQRIAGTSHDKDLSGLTYCWYMVALIYGALILLIALLLPATPKHIRWMWMENKINSVLPENHYLRYINIEYNNMIERFDFITTGFQQNKSVLGGPISPGDNLIMHVYSDEPVYLRGTIRHRYDGSMWETIGTSKTEYLSGDTFNDIPLNERGYYNEAILRVQFEKYLSSTLFSPYRTIGVHAENKNQITLNKDYIIEIPEGIYDGEDYTVRFLRAPAYYEALHTGINNSYNRLENIEDYLQVPTDRITQRTIDLKNKIIAGIEGNYEKAAAFETYLRNNYNYTLNTSVVPHDHEFIDYFLFEEKAGYCTYYATAMAIFLRLEGIPSRYVEGYIAHESSGDNVYEVRENNAHAWVEAYIEPVGWITFEPTSFYPSVNRGPNDGSNNDNEETASKDQPLDGSDMKDKNTFPEEDSRENKDSVTDDNDSSDKADNGNSITKHFMSTVMLCLIFLIIMIIILIRILCYRKNERQFNILSDNEKVIILYQKLLKLIEDLGYPINDGETYYEYSDRIRYRFVPLEEFTDIFIKTKYGNIMPDDIELYKFTDYLDILEEQLKKHLGTVKYAIRRLFHKI